MEAVEVHDVVVVADATVRLVRVETVDVGSTADDAEALDRRSAREPLTPHVKRAHDAEHVRKQHVR